MSDHGIEKAIVSAIEPVVDEIVKLEKRLDEVQLLPGPPGEQGPAGKDADPVNVEEIKASVLEEVKAEVPEILKELIPEPVAGPQGEPGPAGKDADPVDTDQIKAVVLNEIKVELPEALKTLIPEPIPGPRGEQGLPGKDAAAVDVEALKTEITEDLKSHLPEPTHGRDGEDGKDADPELVAKTLATNSDFIDALKPDVQELVKFLMEGHSSELEGEGIKSLGLTSDNRAISIETTRGKVYEIDLPEPIKGDKGEDGKDGQDGAGIVTKQWKPGVYREGVTVTYALGKYYKAICDTASEPGSSDDWERLGSAGFAWKGLRKDGATYENGDLYIDGGSCFIWWEGKGHMFVQRGQRGQQGESGKDGRDGNDAPTIVAVKYTRDGIHLALSDGEVMSADIDGFDSYVKEISQGAIQYWMDAVYQQIEDEGGTPIRAFKGIFTPNQSYSVGDVVTYNKSAWVCKQATSIDYFDEQTSWRRMFSMGGGGGIGGGSTSGWNYQALLPVNMRNNPIQNLGLPTQKTDAATKDYVDRQMLGVRYVQDTGALAVLPGASTQGKLTTLLGTSLNQGSMVVVGVNTSPGADNQNAGIWHYSGTTWQKIEIGSAGGAISATVFSANLVQGTPTDLTAALTAQPALLGGVTPKQGAIAIAQGGSGANAKYNGSAYFDGTKWVMMTPTLSNFIYGALKTDPAATDQVSTGWPTGSVQVTTKNGSREVKALDSAGNWITIYSEVETLQAIASGALFQGTVDEAGLTGLPTPAAANRGWYFTWVGAPNYSITAGTPKIGTDLAGQILNPGDWLQSTGTAWAHVSGDLLSRKRWLSLGSLALYQAGSSYEADSLVRYVPTPGGPLHYYRATRPVLPGDSAPGTANDPAATASQVKFVVTGMPAATGGAVTITITGGPATVTDTIDIDLGTDTTSGLDLQTISITAGMTADQIADAFVNDWTSPDTSCVKTAPGVLTVTPIDPSVQITTLDIDPSAAQIITPALNPWLDITPASSLANMSDVDVATTAPANGDALVWDTAAGKWVPKMLTSPIVYLGEGDFNPANIADPTNLYGMPPGTKPDPTIWPPLPGDQFFSLTSGKVTVYTGATGGTRNPASPTPAVSGSSPVGGVSLGDLSDVDLVTTPQTDGTALVWDAATGKWEPKKVTGDYIPLFKGTFSTGSKSGNTYTAPTNPKEGDIWVDKNSTPPVFKVYRNAAWVQVNWQTDHLGLLSDLANVNVGANGSPGQGDALIFNQLTEQWESGSVPAHIAEYGNTINYSAGTTVYYKGGLFEASKRTTGVSPAFMYGDCWLYHRSLFSGAGDWVGPVSFETVTQVPDETIAPTATFASDDLRPHWTLLWKDDTHFSVWQWELSMKGWTPGSPLPVAQWHRYDTQFTKPKASRIWRNYSTPPQHIGDCVVWVYDDPKGTNVPHYRDFPWILRPIRSDLISMHDVQAENPADESILIWNTSTSYWEAKPNPSYKKTETYTQAEVDAKVSSLVSGLSHEVAVIALQNDPPAQTVADEFYIVGLAPTGAWRGHTNEIAYWDGATWKFQPAQANETRLVEATNESYHWNGSAWVKLAAAGLKFVKLTQAAYDALATKDPQTLYLITA